MDAVTDIPAAPVADRPIATEPSIGDGLQVVSIAKSYDKRTVLTDVSLSVGRGEVIGLLGPDGRWRPADELAEADDQVHVLHRAGKEGLGAAYLHGFAWALLALFLAFSVSLVAMERAGARS